MIPELPATKTRSAAAAGLGGESRYVPPLLFCADIGTSSLKAALIDTAGVQYRRVRVPYALPDGEHGADSLSGADSWLNAFFTAAEQLSDEISVPSVSAVDETSVPADSAAGEIPVPPISALIISGNGPTLVPVTKTGGVLRPIYWYDAGLETGGRSFFLPRVRSFMEQDPGGFARTERFFSPQEWLLWKLGGHPVTVLPHPGYGDYYWNEEECRALGIGGDLFPPFVNMGERIGTLDYGRLEAVPSEKVSALLPPGIPLVAGAADFIMALVGTGVSRRGMVCDRTGSSEGINLCVTGKDLERLPEGKTDLRILPHAFEGLWNLGAVTGESGRLLDRFLTESGRTGISHTALVEEIFRTPGHPGMGVLEKMGGLFLASLEKLEKTGFRIGELVLSGGQCEDPLWNQYKADISDRILKVPEIAAAELAGDAVLGAAALEGGSIRERPMIRIRHVYYPRNPRRRA
jgi:xylulokinase